MQSRQAFTWVQRGLGGVALGALDSKIALVRKLLQAHHTALGQGIGTGALGFAPYSIGQLQCGLVFTPVLLSTFLVACLGQLI